MTEALLHTRMKLNSGVINSSVDKIYGNKATLHVHTKFCAM